MRTGESHLQVVMAVYEPKRSHLMEQVKSLASQRGVRLTLHAVIADMTSSKLVRDVAKACDIPVVLHLPTTKLNAVSAFEFGLRAALESSDDADLFALCDQDDVWYSDKLQKSVAALQALPGSHLVHTDARLVNDDLTEQAPSMFAQERRDPRCGLRRLLYRNPVTGMTAVFSREVVAHALPFPQQAGLFYYHDLWIGLIAAAKGPICFLPEQTVDYRQHANNAIGAIGRRTGPAFLSKSWLRHRFASYSLACYLAKSLSLRADQIGHSAPDAFDRRRLQRLRPYLRHFGTGWAFYVDAAAYGMRGYFELADHAFSQGVVKSGRLVWALRKMLNLDLRNRLSEFDDIGYSMAPGTPPRSTAMSQPDANPGGTRNKLWYSYLDHRVAPRWQIHVDSNRAPCCSILIPTLNPTEIFAGIATAVQLGIGLAERGQNVRFIATDLPMVSAHAARDFIANRIDPVLRAEALSRIELLCGIGAEEIAFAPEERIIATAWWTAHVANKICAHPEMKTERFHYLIQDYEPNFYAWGAEFAGAMESYSMPCTPIFNTTLLREYVAEQGHDFSGQTGLAFRPSIDVSQYSDLVRLDGRSKKRIAIYGRPEVPRNMFSMCVEALAELCLAKNLSRDEVEIVSVGLPHETILLPGNMTVQSLGKLPMSEYPVFLSTVDIGVSLMYSPHPSHLPIEMAAAGARVVTNHFGPKDLSQLSPLIRSATPSSKEVSRELIASWESLDDPMPQAARHIDLSPLGQSLDEVADELAKQFSPKAKQRRVA